MLRQLSCSHGGTPHCLRSVYTLAAPVVFAYSARRQKPAARHQLYLLWPSVIPPGTSNSGLTAVTLSMERRATSD